MTIKTLKPLDFGNRRVLTTEEALKQLEGYVPEKTPRNPTDPPVNLDLNPDQNGNLEGSVEILGDYILMAKASTKALGIHALRDAYTRGDCPDHFTVEIEGSNLVRPLTFKENIEARVNDYKTLTNPDGSKRTKEERLHLFSRWLDSCTGVVYKKKTSKFKIVPVCNELVTIDKGFGGAYLTIDYDKVVGTELDRKNAKYEELLTKAEVLEHPAWLTAVEEDRTLLEKYTQIVFSELKEKYNQDTGMIFWVTSNTAQDQGRALFVYYLVISSGAYGNDNLNSDGSFLQVAPSKTP